MSGELSPRACTVGSRDALHSHIKCTLKLMKSTILINFTADYCKCGIDCDLKYNSFKGGQMISVVTLTDWDERHTGLLSSI